ncbi:MULTISPECIES: hypothetical protein [unclassified Sphingomonas]|uniref:hypothetical protein n=1 Tax=unclassified Sphingomonas TaxID=196159 RepID=UPI0008326F00|nr:MULTISPECIES: hypothetical protein [unclassified Sphingomonas]
MIELGIREFRKRLTEVTGGTDLVIITNNGTEVGAYLPKRWLRDIARARKAADAVADAQRELRARGIDLDAELAAMGLSPYGEPLKDA